MRITESQLRSVVRRIIRENKRQQALDEGFFDKVKDFFKGDTKKAVEKVPSLISNIKSAFQAYCKARGIPGKVETDTSPTKTRLDFRTDDGYVYYIEIKMDPKGNSAPLRLGRVDSYGGEAFNKLFGSKNLPKFSNIWIEYSKESQKSSTGDKEEAQITVKYLEDFAKLLGELAKNPPKN